MLNEIIQSRSIKDYTSNMHTWYNKSKFANEILPFFEGVTFFNFQPIFSFGNPPLNLHFYPAITDDGFVLYIIDSEKDKLAVYLNDPDNFSNFIIEAPLERSSNPIVQDGESKIPTREAIERIENWTEYNPEYIETNAPLGDVFIAFDYHANDINPNGDIRGYFGLYQKDGSPEWNADIILLSDNSFYNTVRPVPPFGQGGGDEFFLLSASLG